MKALLALILAVLVLVLCTLLLGAAPVRWALGTAALFVGCFVAPLAIAAGVAALIVELIRSAVCDALRRRRAR